MFLNDTTLSMQPSFNRKSLFTPNSFFWHSISFGLADSKPQALIRYVYCPVTALGYLRYRRHHWRGIMIDIAFSDTLSGSMYGSICLDKGKRKFLTIFNRQCLTMEPLSERKKKRKKNFTSHVTERMNVLTRCPTVRQLHWQLQYVYLDR